MKFPKSLYLLVFVLLVSSWSSPAEALQRGGQRQEKPFELTESSGPWLIMCASFVGEEAEFQALALARELRTALGGRAGLDAFIYRRSFDFSDSIQGLGYDDTEGTRLPDGRMVAKRKKMRTNNAESFDEIAVLIGAFPTVEDARAQQVLQKVKYMMPRSLGKIDSVVTETGNQHYLAPESSDNQRMRIWRSINRTVNANADKKKGPMGAAFLLANPLLPDEYFAAYQVDEFVLKLNRRYKHSLMSNPSPYSVRVATFAGDSTFETNEINQLQQEQTWRLRNGKAIQESKLALATAKAHRLTTELQKLGIPAYEFHDRAESYVCVGGFDWLKRTDEAGVEIQNPEMVRTIEAFKGSVENFPGVQGAVRPKSLADIARLVGAERKVPKLHKLGVVFDVQPLPVRVPQR